MLKFQFPNDVFAWFGQAFVWIEAHPGTAAWAQALGAILTVGAAVWIARGDTRRTQAAERRRAQGLAICCTLRWWISATASLRLSSPKRYLAPDFCPPESLNRHDAELYLLGPAGGVLLQMISTLRANAQYISEMQQHQVLLTPELWPGIARNLHQGGRCVSSG